MLTSLFFSNALAGSPAHYNPDEISKNSKLFAKSAEISGPRFTQAEQNLTKYSTELSEMEISSSLLSNDAFSNWFNTNQRFLVGYHIQTNRHIALLTEDYDKEFWSAVERALLDINHDGDVSLCETKGIHSLMGAKPKCDGISLDMQIANRIDTDAQLQQSLDEMQGIPWPELKISPMTQPSIPITGEENSIYLYDVAKVFLIEELDAHRNWLEEQTDTVIEGIEDGDQEAIKQAEQFKAEYKNRIAKDGQRFTAAINAYAIKKEGKYPQLSSIALCGNAKNFGGCPGTDKTSEVLDILKGDKKFYKELKKQGI